jgi:large subunit ribosomal protein L10
MKTKVQKVKHIEEGVKDLDKSQTLIFADFSGTSTKEINILRETLKAIGAKFQVFKKRLFRIAAEKNNVELPIEKFEGQLGVVFAPDDPEKVAGPIYKFSKTNENFKIIGGIDLKEKKFLEADFVKMLGSLPSREVLLSQLAAMFTIPIKKLLVILNEKGRK